MPDWTAWNTRYDDRATGWWADCGSFSSSWPTRSGSGRPGRSGLVSVCAGQGRDVVEVLTGHPRAADVSALLVELDRATVDAGRRLATAAGLTGVRFVVGDAAQTDLYRDTAPADIVLVCGVSPRPPSPAHHGVHHRHHRARLPRRCRHRHRATVYRQFTVTTAPRGGAGWTGFPVELRRAWEPATVS